MFFQCKAVGPHNFIFERLGIFYLCKLQNYERNAERVVVEETLEREILDTIQSICVQTIMGNPTENVQKLFNLEKMMAENDYNVHMETCDSQIVKDIYVDGIHKQFRMNESKKPKKDRTRFNRSKWLDENADFIQKHFGNPSAEFFHFFIFSPKNYVHFTKHCFKLICADTSHVRWGARTLYSIYGVSANYNAVCFAHSLKD